MLGVYIDSENANEAYLPFLLDSACQDPINDFY